ncbi:MAG: hypothetical protein V1837_06155 [Candidatus Woesearchaeota archaeon]
MYNKLSKEGFKSIFKRRSFSHRDKRLFDIIGSPQNLRPEAIESIEARIFDDSLLETSGHIIQGDQVKAGHHITVWDSFDLDGKLISSEALLVEGKQRYDLKYERSIGTEEYDFSVINFDQMHVKIDTYVPKLQRFRRNNPKLPKINIVNPRHKLLDDYELPSYSPYGLDLSDCKLKGDLIASKAKVENELCLYGIRIKGNAYMTGARIGSAFCQLMKIGGTAYMQNMVIKENADFSDITCVELNMKGLRTKHLDLGDARIHRLNLTDSHIRDVLNLDGARIAECSFEALKVKMYTYDDSTKIPGDFRGYLSKFKGIKSHEFLKK